MPQPFEISGSTGPFAVPGAGQNYQNPLFRPGAWGANFAINANRATPEQFTRSDLIYTRPGNPSWQDIFAIAESDIQRFGGGRDHLVESDFISKVYQGDMAQGRTQFQVTDSNNDGRVTIDELAARTYFQDAAISSVLSQNLNTPFSNAAPGFTAPDGRITAQEMALADALLLNSPQVAEQTLLKIKNQLVNPALPQYRTAVEAHQRRINPPAPQPQQANVLMLMLLQALVMGLMGIIRPAAATTQPTPYPVRTADHGINTQLLNQLPPWQRNIQVQLAQALQFSQQVA
jgi:hypothetical protein